MATQQDIVVTGLGTVSSIGIGKEPFWASLLEGRSGIRRLDLFEDPDMPPPIGGPVANFDPKQYVRPRKSLKVMSRDIQLGFTAADLAFADSGLRDKPADPDRLGVVFGAETIPCELDEIMPAYRSCIPDGKFDFTLWGPSAMKDLFPLWMLKYLPNMPACHIGIGQDARGPNNSVTHGDVSSLSAIAEAVRVVKRGGADVMIAGGVGSRMHPLLWMRGILTGMSHRGDAPTEASRPFDANRDGVVNGEGAGAFILENREYAERRGAKILGAILGIAETYEPALKGRPWQGESIRQAILSALCNAGLKPADVGCVVANGMSTLADDRIEARAIRETLGDVPVTAPKSYFGYLGTASGALEAVLGVLAVQHKQIPATLNYETPDPECPVNVVRGQPMPLSQSAVLVLSHSPQGQAVAMVLGE